ncbi:MAG: peptide deformylase [Candidatus Latescibacterota bacterium]
MAILKVSRMGHPVLRQRACEVPAPQVGETALQRLIDDMIETMLDDGGIGLAAPQVFRPLRLIVLGDPAADPEDPGAIPLQVLLNPRVLRLSTQTEQAWEGCLSIPGLRGVVPRPCQVQVEGLDREGRQLQVQAAGMHARVLQHEVDHLDGILFLDRMPDLRRLAFLEEYHRYWHGEGGDEPEGQVRGGEPPEGVAPG